MKKVRIVFATCILLISVLFYVVGTAGHRKPVELPPLVMIEDKLYQLRGDSDKDISSESDGTIKEIVIDQIPFKNEQANFGDTNMEYWIMENLILIKVNNNFLEFKEIEK